MDRKGVIAFLGNDWSLVENTIRDVLKSDISLLDYTNSSILSHSGKMMRPMLSLLVSRACKGGSDVCPDVVKVAAASELLHNATLLHDDVADSSDTRRGFPTVRSLLGAPASVLVGDFWLVRAVNLILSCENDADKVIRLFSRTLSDLAEGEMLQLQKASSCDTSLEDYQRIIYGKTASLFQAACESAAIVSGASPEHIAAARDYAVALGLAFQIKDDIFDYSDEYSIGKPQGVDILEQKITAPLLGAFENAGPDEAAHIRSMVKDIADHPENAAAIVGFVKENGGLEYACALLEEHISKALKSLEVFPQCEARSMLESLARYTADRKI